MTASTRILVALDSVRNCRATVQIAADLAERLQVELEALFIEDIDLVNLAALPFAHEITFSANRSPLDSGIMEQTLKVQARQVRDLIVEAAARRKISWRFRTTRGQVLTELISAAAEVDFLALGHSLQSRLRREQAGVRIAGAQSLATLLQSDNADAPLEGPIFVLYDGSRAGRRALEMAHRLAGSKRPVSVLVVARDIDSANRLRREARKHCGSLGTFIGERMPQCRDIPAVLAALQGERQGIVVVPVDGGAFDDEGLQVLTGDLRLPVLIVRETTDDSRTTES